MILLSDGSDVHSVLGMQQVRTAARRSQAQIFWVCLGDAPEQSPLITQADSFRSAEQQARERRLLATVVGESGGRVVPVANLAGIEPAFRDILQELREQYAIGYYPSRDLDDGSWHKVKVRVRVGGRSLRVRTRTGYLD